MAMKSREKTRGCLAIASDSSKPLSTSARSSPITAASFRSSVCSSRMTSAVTTLSPASIIVANWREKIWRDFALTFLTAIPWALAPEPRSSSPTARSPRRRSASRAAPTSGALISPVDSRPVALMAVYAKDATAWESASTVLGLSGQGAVPMKEQCPPRADASRHAAAPSRASA
jgi:hypothetical protein